MDSDGKRRDAVEVVEVGTKNSTASNGGRHQAVVAVGKQVCGPAPRRWRCAALSDSLN